MDVQLIAPSERSVRGGRRRGSHSTACLNPNPVHQRSAAKKALPGALGQLARRAKKTPISSSIVLLHAMPFMVSYTRTAGRTVKTVGRTKRFKPERANLIDAFCRAVIDCLDAATWMPTRTLESIAAELNVTNSRISRLLDEVLLPAGLLIGMNGADYKPHYNSTHGVFFPAMLAVTEKFFEACGADRRMIDRLYTQRDEKLATMLDVKTGKAMTLRAAQALRKQWAWDRAYELRCNSARAQKKRVAIAGLASWDLRLAHVGRQLMLSDPMRYLGSEHSQLIADAWAVLRRFGFEPPPRQVH